MGAGEGHQHPETAFVAEGSMSLQPGKDLMGLENISTAVALKLLFSHGTNALGIDTST